MKGVHASLELIHLSGPVRNTLKSLSTEPAVMPGGMTVIVQPFNAAINKPFFQKLHEKEEEECWPTKCWWFYSKGATCSDLSLDWQCTGGQFRCRPHSLSGQFASQYGGFVPCDHYPAKSPLTMTRSSNIKDFSSQKRGLHNSFTLAYMEGWTYGRRVPIFFTNGAPRARLRAPLINISY